MLVLTRKVGERVQIGPSVFVRVLRSNGGRVRLGIEAPRGVEILRDELGSEMEFATSKPRLEVAHTGND